MIKIIVVIVTRVSTVGNVDYIWEIIMYKL